MNKKLPLLDWMTEIQAIAQNGLAYCTNEFDIERYIRLRELAAEMAAAGTGDAAPGITDMFALEKGYATPKIDVRSFVLQDNKLLLVKERADGLWTLPGGWADINESPAENVARETKEESGFEVSVLRLLALWDKSRHDHPIQWPYIYKLFFHCEITGGEGAANLEISDIDFFALDDLPPLSTPRVTKIQIERLYHAVHHADKTLFD